MIALSTLSRPVIFIIGETATGKTNLAHQLAKIIDAEIINADSTLVRKELNIGTDKPSKSMRNQVKYHLLDVASIRDTFSVAEYKKLAQEALEKIWSSKKIPIIVGGSGLYINSILYNYDFVITDQQKYNVLEDKPLNELISIANSKGFDLSRIDIKNKRRVINYINNGGTVNTKKSISNAKILLIGIQIDRKDLNHNIEKRVDKMFRSGLEAEVRTLFSDQFIKPETLNIIGYKEWLSYLNHKADLAEVRTHIIRDTKILAKKQRTWFKNKIDYKINWLKQPYKLEDVVALVTTFLNN